MNKLLRNPLATSALLILFTSVATLATGCGGGTQVSSDNREIIVSLATAVSTHETKWLDSNVELIEKRRAEGKCSDAEYAAFQGIITKARAGDWEAAQTAVYDLRDAQEPTAEDLKNLAERKRSQHDHGLPKPKAKGAKKS